MAAPAPKPGKTGAAIKHPRWRRRLRVVYLVVSGTVFIASIWGSCSALRRPDWFVPATINHARLAEDKRVLVDLLDDIGEALNRGRPITVNLSEDQLNRWLTARSELPEGLELRVDPLQHPQVTLMGDGQVRVAAIMPRGGFELVLSCVLALERTDADFELRFESVALGSLPMPLAWLRRVIDEERLLAESGARRGPDGAWGFENKFIWPNGKRRFTIEGLQIDAGDAELKLRPLPE